MNSNFIKVSIVIPQYNAYNHTIECVNSILNSNYKVFQIIISDDCSSNDSISQIKKSCPDSIVLQNEYRSGFSATVNRGLTYALKNKADFIFLINNDTILDKNAITELVKYANIETVIAPYIYNYDTPDAIWALGIELDIKGFHPLIKQVSGDTNVSEIESVTGCAALFPAALFKTVGFWDERYFLYNEDLDYFYRVKKCGFKSFVVKSSKIYHKGGATTSGLDKPENTYYITRNRFLSVKTHANLQQIIYFCFIFTGHFLRRILFYFKNKMYKNIVALYWGMVDGMWGKYGKCTRNNIL